jgi:hypothetical protein
MRASDIGGLLVVRILELLDVEIGVGDIQKVGVGAR